MGDIVDLSHVSLNDRPLIVLDVDDVVLQFLTPFEAYLAHLGHQLLPRSFRLHGNIVSTRSMEALPDEAVTALIEGFFEAQEAWQIPFTDTVETLGLLGECADIVFLTAMPPRFALRRRRLLDTLGLDFPLVATEEPKGPVVRTLQGDRTTPLAFIDDMARNLASVGEHVPECLLIHMMPDSEIHRMAPKPPDTILRATDWPHAKDVMDAHFSGTPRTGMPVKDRT